MHSLYVMFIVCNVAALTFYATIYEDICCICNKYIEKHALGTASTAGSLCSFIEFMPGLMLAHYLKHLYCMPV